MGLAGVGGPKDRGEGTGPPPPPRPPNGVVLSWVAGRGSGPVPIQRSYHAAKIGPSRPLSNTPQSPFGVNHVGIVSEYGESFPSSWVWHRSPHGQAATGLVSLTLNPLLHTDPTRAGGCGISDELWGQRALFQRDDYSLTAGTTQARTRRRVLPDMDLAPDLGARIGSLTWYRRRRHLRRAVRAHLAALAGLRDPDLRLCAPRARRQRVAGGQGPGDRAARQGRRHGDARRRDQPRRPARRHARAADHQRQRQARLGRRSDGRAQALGRRRRRRRAGRVADRQGARARPDPVEHAGRDDARPPHRQVAAAPARAARVPRQFRAQARGRAGRRRARAQADPDRDRSHAAAHPGARSARASIARHARRERRPRRSRPTSSRSAAASRSPESAPTASSTSSWSSSARRPARSSSAG